MTTLVRTTVLSLSLLAGIAATAYAQSNNVAALPPGAAAAPAVAPVGPAPSPQYVGPSPGSGWYGKEQESAARYQPSPEWLGPKAGQGWYGKEEQTQAVAPSPQYPGPRPN
jgi:hypothetical protein